jgi:hypothetical protein
MLLIKLNDFHVSLSIFIFISGGHPHKTNVAKRLRPGDNRDLTFGFPQSKDFTLEMHSE